ncbi:MAG: hypothetical protein ABWX84_01040 [Nocardioides sp.]
MRALACAAALLGGACWVVRYFTDIEVLYLAGFVLLAVAALLAGLSAVPKAPTWLQAIVGIGSVGLFWSVTMTLHSAAADAAVDLVLGVVAIVGFGYSALKLRGAERPVKGRRVGAHAR